MTTPDWLTKREGNLREGPNSSTYMVVLNGHPQYRLVAVPATGKFSCVVTQSNNGKRLDEGVNYPSLNEALQGGLEELRKKLGW